MGSEMCIRDSSPALQPAEPPADPPAMDLGEVSESAGVRPAYVDSGSMEGDGPSAALLAVAGSPLDSSDLPTDLPAPLAPTAADSQPPAADDAPPVPSTLGQTPSTLGQASSTLRVPGRLIPLDSPSVMR